MALKGTYTFKGIEVKDAYIRVSQVNYNLQDNQKTTVKTAAKYNEDGSIKSEAVMQTEWSKNNVANYTAGVYKDQATRDADPSSYITLIYGNFDYDVKSSAKNSAVQAYAAMKAEDTYKDFTDV